MQFKQLWDKVSGSPEDYYLYPINSYWWIAVPSIAVINPNDKVLDYLPKQLVQFSMSLGKHTKLQPFLLALFNKAEVPQPVSLNDCILINTQVETYCIIGQAITLFEEDLIHQYTFKD